MLTSSSLNPIIDEEILKSAGAFFTGDLNNLEKQLYTYKKDKARWEALGAEYKKELELTLSKLYEFSQFVFLQTRIKNIKSYKNNEKIPKDFQYYRNINYNIAEIVKYDI